MFYTPLAALLSLRLAVFKPDFLIIRGLNRDGINCIDESPSARRTVHILFSSAKLDKAKRHLSASLLCR